MADYILSCCSTADLTPEHFAKRDLHYLCFHYFMDNVSYQDDLGQTMPFDKFYQAMVDGADTRTSQVNAEEYAEYFEKLLAEGKDILHLTLSGGISGTINSARIAAEELREKYPERKIYIVDSVAAASGFGLLMDKLADLRDAGKTIDEVRDWAEANKNKLHHWFFSTDLTFFIKGGRVSKLSGWFGTALHICPLLNVNNEGKLIAREKLRGKPKVIRQIVKKMEEHAQDGLSYSGKCYISHSACLEDAQAVAKLITERFPNLAEPISIYSIGTTIGSHTGPGTVALFFWGDERTE